MKKILLIVVVCCLALTAALFPSCKKEQKSSYQYAVALDDSQELDEQMERVAAQFELNALPKIIEIMQKTADQSGSSSIIFKDTKSTANKRAKEAFSGAVTQLREAGELASYRGLVVVLKGLDNDTNKWSVIDKVTL